ncbi:MAG: type II toxin-antitoxin system HicB family antitoxin [Formosimonas sp.]
MKNILKINGYSAVVQYDPDIDMLRGEFIGLNGGADFYAKDIDTLKHEGAISLNVFLQACAEDGVEPLRRYSGKFMVRVDNEVHHAAIVAAASEGKSLNQWVRDAIAREAIVV